MLCRFLSTRLLPPWLGLFLGPLKERINKWDFTKIKSFCMAKENISKMKREPTLWENIFANDTSDKGLISEIHKESTQFHSGKQTTKLKNGQRT